ncbi:MAG: helix-turn-helix domain-containing protein [Candidatus Spechtbacterales bacterium]|nr:helix-turn-helix domain-containing protein [Candidatus Spechtbacterales bacterium]
MQLHKILEQIGFNDKEAKVYIALLKLGESNVKDISDKSGIARTSVYTPLNSLIDRGAVEFYKKRGRNYYVAAKPEKILSLSKKSTQLLESNLDEFHKLETPQNRPDIKFFEGSESIKLLFHEILDEKRPIMAITSVEGMNKIANDYFDDFISKRIEQNLPVRLLTNKWEDAVKMKQGDSGSLRETRFIPEKYKFHTANYIFGNKVAMLSLRQEPVMGVLINDEEIADTQKMYFEIMWEVAEHE